LPIGNPANRMPIGMMIWSGPTLRPNGPNSKRPTKA
jgi:hypothetical protein